MSKSQEQGQEPPAQGDTAPKRDLPSTPRGLRTRASLVAAARTVFERDGFIDSRLTDITKEAKCSTGTFYTYFDSKEEALAAVLHEAQEDMLHPGPPQEHHENRSVIESLDDGNRAYIKAYKRNAKLMLLLEQVAAVDPEFRQLRLDRGQAFAKRNCKWVRKLQDEGYADPSLDPVMSASALSLMVGRMAYYKYALKEPGWGSDDLLVETATKLWVNALGIPADGSRRGD
ncbi:TetR/AcrR family transcriptional regulator [Brevibacterium aurantiacum]|uniref:TetR family transcriptional regulator n=1 Tax=Brevibacterium aurantiacum TaxID=273384 RepID=A0A2A3Z2U4_BREAU|nr:TetR/AcrR family transcriptional regulator [Brevibacterium aurantiacum]PCC45831.1 TetR family transcriptional regulator [Brevibacterium aurantiacum]